MADLRGQFIALARQPLEPAHADIVQGQNPISHRAHSAQPCRRTNSSMNSLSARTASIEVALYRLARIPPTERWPSRFISPAWLASARNVLSSAGTARINGTFIHERQDG